MPPLSRLEFGRFCSAALPEANLETARPEAAPFRNQHEGKRDLSRPELCFGNYDYGDTVARDYHGEGAAQAVDRRLGNVFARVAAELTPVVARSLGGEVVAVDGYRRGVSPRAPIDFPSANWQR